MRQDGAAIEVELFQPLTKRQVFDIFGGAGIVAEEMTFGADGQVATFSKFEILRFSLCSESAAQMRFRTAHVIVKDEEDLAPGFVEVGQTEDRKHVILNHPKIMQDERGGHILFSPAEAISLGELLIKHGRDCV